MFSLISEKSQKPKKKKFPPSFFFFLTVSTSVSVYHCRRAKEDQGRTDNVFETEAPLTTISGLLRLFCLNENH